MDNQIIRVFFALPTPHEQVNLIQDFINSFNPEISRNIRWVKQNHFHITLIFIAKLKSSHIEPIHLALCNQLIGFRSISVKLNGFKAFPDSVSPRVLWIGLSFPESLLELNQAITEIFKKFGYKNKERSFSPHLTIGRIGKKVSARDITRIGQYIGEKQFISTGNFFIDKGILFQSDLKPGGPEYKTLFSIPFSK